jgi:hypothetical protein
MSRPVSSRTVTDGRNTPRDLDHMALPIKLISTDFDGTIFAEFENPPISRRLTDLIGELQHRGAKWVINTGRDLPSLMEALARARISVQPDYLVLVEREIYQHDGVRYVPIEPWNSDCARDHSELFARVRPVVPELMTWINSRFRATVYEDAYSPFCLIAGNNGEADVIHHHLRAFCDRFPKLTVVRNDVYARFSHAGYNKGTALSEVSRRLGLSPGEVFAAGDHLNDLPMLTLDYARWLAAPDNAIASVKEAVARQHGVVSASSHSDGVAEGLERHLAVAGRQ